MGFKQESIILGMLNTDLTRDQLEAERPVKQREIFKLGLSSSMRIEEREQMGQMPEI